MPSSHYKNRTGTSLVDGEGDTWYEFEWSGDLVYECANGGMILSYEEIDARFGIQEGA